MKKAKNGKKLIALVLVLATMMACMISAFAYYKPSDPEYITRTIDGVTYKISTELYLDSVRGSRAAVYVSTVGQVRVPARTIYVLAELYDITSTEAISYSGWKFNETTDYWAYAVTPTGYSDYVVRAAGSVQIKTDTTYEFIDAPGTAYYKYGDRSLDISDKLKSALDTNGNYPKTANGETYGSGLLASIVGYKPDLISAIGTNGLHGYIRNEDACPKFVTEEDYEIYMANLEAAGRKIPLYDLQGNVIGDFEICESEEIVPGAESPEVIREAIEREMNMGQY